jgi:carboxyl-terminal processing protease
MIRGMVQASEDPYAVFLEPIQHELETNALQGNFGGIGVEMDRTAEGDLILHPFSNGTGYRAGIREGDRLLQIDEMEISAETPLENIEAALSGPIGEKVLVKLARPPDDLVLELLVPRERIDLPSVTWYLYPERSWIAVIKIAIIAASTPEEVRSAFGESIRMGATEFVLDLRDNGGGLLTAGIDTARLFLHDGVLVQQQYRGKHIETFGVNQPGPFIDYPLVLLINKTTASAAEIIAGCLKAHGRATIIGEDSFGKNTIQLVFDLSDGSSLHVTAAKWWIPGTNSSAADEVVHPDILLAPELASSEQAVRAAVEFLAGQ